MLQHPLLKPALIYGTLGCSLAVNLVMLLDRPESGAAETPPATSAPAALDGATPPAAPGLVDPAANTALASAALPAAAPVAPISGDWKIVSSELQSSIARTFNNADPDHGEALAQTFARLFVWDLDLRRDLQKGDRLEVSYRVISDAEIEIGAARLVSRKYNKVFAAYRWQAPGDAFPSYWHEDGMEVPFRLQNGPLKDYEQITSLLKDRPTHEGMDFKTPSGTPVYSPKEGLVTRVNWNWSGNGNCVEVQMPDGVLAKYLHLSENHVKEGERVTAGQQVGLTGNTGHSTAPHLHYQLSRGEKIIDPIDYHGAERRKLTPEALASFSQERARLDAELGSSVASR